MIRATHIFLLAAVPAAAALAHPGPGIVVDSKERVCFVDFTRDRIMRIDEKGEVSVFVDGAREDRFHVPHHLSMDSRGNIYTASDREGKVWRIGPGGEAEGPEQVYPPRDWVGINFAGVGGNPMAVDEGGNIYLCNERQGRHHQILRISREGLITSVAGAAIGHADGKGAAARFGEGHGAVYVCDKGGNLFVTDGSCIRRVAPDGTVTTFAGAVERGSADGSRAEARFGAVIGMNFDGRGNLLVADAGNGSIRRITTEGVVSTLPRPRLAEPHPREDEEATRLAPIGTPVGVAAGPSGDVYILDYPAGDWPRVSRMKEDGTAQVIAYVREEWGEGR